MIFKNSPERRSFNVCWFSWWKYDKCLFPFIPATVLFQFLLFERRDKVSENSLEIYLVSNLLIFWVGSLEKESIEGNYTLLLVKSLGLKPARKNLISVFLKKDSTIKSLYHRLLKKTTGLFKKLLIY